MDMNSQLDIRFLFFSVFLSSFTFTRAQVIKIPHYSVETSITLSGGRQTPFWLVSDQYGLITPNKFNGLLKLGLKTEIPAEKKVAWDYGIEIVNRQGNGNALYLHQAYIRLKCYFINLQAGSIEEKFGDQDSVLSSGGLLWSGNARPMPKISIVINRYTPIPYTKGYLEFMGGISHGWFGDNRFVNNIWLHHKYLYLQAGGKLPVNIHYGLHHFAQWGGQSTDSAVGNLPGRIEDFKRIFLAKGGDGIAPMPDQIYVLGNHLGSRNFGLDINLNRLKTGIYWQTIFEDRSGWYWGNRNDGLWGIYLHLKEENHLINGLVYEFINTTDQSGTHVAYWLLNGVRYYTPVNGGAIHVSGGNDDYFNHYYYRYGWTYHDMTIGTPFITSPAISNNNESESEYIPNNKITGHHMGFEGEYRNIHYIWFFTYYVNYGTNAYPFDVPLSQFSMLIQAQFRDILPWDMIAGFSFGYDRGKMYGNNTGLKISLSRSGYLNNK